MHISTRDGRFFMPIQWKRHSDTRNSSVRLRDTWSSAARCPELGLSQARSLTFSVRNGQNHLCLERDGITLYGHWEIPDFARP